MWLDSRRIMFRKVTYLKNNFKQISGELLESLTENQNQVSSIQTQNPSQFYSYSFPRNIIVCAFNLSFNLP